MSDFINVHIVYCCWCFYCYSWCSSDNGLLYAFFFGGLGFELCVFFLAQWIPCCVSGNVFVVRWWMRCCCCVSLLHIVECLHFGWNAIGRSSRNTPARKQGHLLTRMNAKNLSGGNNVGMQSDPSWTQSIHSAKQTSGSQVLRMHIPQLTYFKRMHTLLILGWVTWNASGGTFFCSYALIKWVLASLLF